MFFFLCVWSVKWTESEWCQICFFHQDWIINKPTALCTKPAESISLSLSGSHARWVCLHHFLTCSSSSFPLSLSLPLSVSSFSNTSSKRCARRSVSRALISYMRERESCSQHEERDALADRALVPLAHPPYRLLHPFGNASVLQTFCLSIHPSLLGSKRCRAWWRRATWQPGQSWQTCVLFCAGSAWVVLCVSVEAT